MDYEDTSVMRHFHDMSHNNKEKIQSVDRCRCGCFYCITTFSGDDITEWIDAKQTALCPNCGIDSVIPEPEIALLEVMYKRYFN